MHWQGMTEFLRVFGTPAHIEGPAGDTFVGWCDGWGDHAVYHGGAAARILARFDDGYGNTDGGEELVCTALAAGGALLRLCR